MILAISCGLMLVLFALSWGLMLMILAPSWGLRLVIFSPSYGLRNWKSFRPLEGWGWWVSRLPGGLRNWSFFCSPGGWCWWFFRSPDGWDWWSFRHPGGWGWCCKDALVIVMAGIFLYILFVPKLCCLNYKKYCSLHLWNMLGNLQILMCYTMA